MGRAAVLDDAQAPRRGLVVDEVVEDDGERAGVTHALVHRYVGSKASVFRAVLERDEGALLAAAPDDSDLLESAARMLREGLLHHRDYVRLVIRSAMSGLSYERTTGRFAATERLVELAQRSAYAASPAERAEKDLDPRLVVACVVSLFLGLAAAESWLVPAVGLQGMGEAISSLASSASSSAS